MAKLHIHPQCCRNSERDIILFAKSLEMIADLKTIYYNAREKRKGEFYEKA